MKEIKVLGSGCRNCINTATLIEQEAQRLGVPVEVEKVTDMQAIMGYGVMATPAVVLDGRVVHSGGVPSARAVSEWLAS